MGLEGGKGQGLVVAHASTASPSSMYFLLSFPILPIGAPGEASYPV